MPCLDGMACALPGRVGPTSKKPGYRVVPAPDAAVRAVVHRIHRTVGLVPLDVHSVCPIAQSTGSMSSARGSAAESGIA